MEVRRRNLDLVATSGDTDSDPRVVSGGVVEDDDPGSPSQSGVHRCLSPPVLASFGCQDRGGTVNESPALLRQLHG